MFTTLTADFKIKDSIKQPVHQAQYNHVKKSNIVGANKRSKTGCLCCRKLKKRCDEVHPNCGKCTKRGVECIWPASVFVNNTPDFTRFLKTIDKKDKNNCHLKILKSDVNEETHNIQFEEIGSRKVPEFSPQQLPIPNLDSIISSNRKKFISPQMTINYPTQEFMSPTLKSPSNNICLFLDEQSSSYLNYFHFFVTKHLSITRTGTTNYFMQTFFTVAQNNEAAMCALAAWGGYFKEKQNFAKVDFLLNRARALINKQFNNKVLDKFDRYILVSYYCISIGIEVCRGDMKNWWEYFRACCKLLQKNGGLIQFCQEHHCSNEVKWLCSNIQFHDLCSSATQKNGTLIPMNEYEILFTRYKILEVGGYGLDAFQGCIQPIMLLLGELIHANVNFKRRREMIDSELRLKTTTKEISELRSERIRLYIEIDSAAHNFKQRVMKCQPSHSQIELLDDEVYLENQSILFEVYREICQLYILLYINLNAPSSVEVQTITLNCMSLIESLVESSVVSALTMALLICGTSCVTAKDRESFENIFDKVFEKYKPQNTRKVLNVLHRIWELNPQGNTCIDWADVCEANGWILCTC